MWPCSDSLISRGLKGPLLLFHDVTEIHIKKCLRCFQIVHLIACLVYQNPTHWSVIYYEVHHESCCTSVDDHCALLCMYRGSEVLSPMWPRRPFCIQNLHQGWELDPSGWNICHFGGRCRCTEILQSSNIWFGRFLTGLWKNQKKTCFRCSCWVPCFMGDKTINTQHIHHL